MSKHLRQPFVLTLSVAALACGQEVVTFSSSGSGGSSSSTGNGTSSNGTTSGSGGNGTSSSSSVGQGGAGGSTPLNCPAKAPSAYDQCTLEGEGACTYTIECQSGPVELSFTCSESEYGWRVLEQPCDFEYDSCPGTELYCSGTWWMPQGTNPPAPCPDEMPAENATCFGGGFGGVHEHCGYRCESDPSVWSVTTCYSEPGMDGEWESDGACEP
jgi:hypothetical protein